MVGGLLTVKGNFMRVLNVKDVVGMTGLSKVTIWRKEKSGNFPKRINLTSRRVGWIESEIVEWLEDRPRGICGNGENL
jgi:prophage regulatory protein